MEYVTGSWLTLASGSAQKESRVTLGMVAHWPHGRHMACGSHGTFGRVATVRRCVTIGRWCDYGRRCDHHCKYIGMSHRAGCGYIMPIQQ